MVRGLGPIPRPEDPLTPAAPPKPWEREREGSSERPLAIPIAIQPTPQAAYVHVPFCEHHCGYCNFTVIVGHDALVPTYLAALEKELQGLQAPRAVRTLYVGGGSPSHLPLADMRGLLRLLAQWLPCAESPAAPHEFTVEANPGELTGEMLQLLTAAGVNRISLGVQSFNPRKLTALDRKHTAEHVWRALTECRRFDLKLGVDLMFAAPGEGLQEWSEDLDRLMDWHPEHISTYGLTIEKGTVFWNRREHGALREVDEERQREMYLLAIDRLTSAGYEHYEVSNFALPTERSLHNQTYWRCEPYFGFGPGAARYLNGSRELNHRSTSTYLHRLLSGRSAIEESECLDEEQRARERLIFGLRMLEGVARDDFQAETGFGIETLAGSQIEQFVRSGFLSWKGNRLCLTREGLLLSDSLWPELL